MKRWPDKTQLEAWRSYYECSARIARLLERRLKARSELSSGEYNVLLVLSEAKKPLRMGVLATKVVFAPSRLTYTVGVLERRGLVARQPDPRDGRALMVMLTPEGQRVFREAAAPHLQDVYEVAISHLDAADVAHLARIFSRLGQELGE